MTALLVVTILNQKEEVVTLRQLDSLFLLQPDFKGMTTLPVRSIERFVSLHPAYSVKLQAIVSGKSSGNWTGRNKGKEVSYE